MTEDRIDKKTVTSNSGFMNHLREVIKDINRDMDTLQQESETNERFGSPDFVSSEKEWKDVINMTIENHWTIKGEKDENLKILKTMLNKIMFDKYFVTELVAHCKRMDDER